MKMKASSALAFVALMLAVFPSVCRALTYATIEDINTTRLANAVQITISASGTLDWYPEGNKNLAGREFSGTRDRIAIRFSGARSSISNFVDVGQYPVSYVQTYVPQDAQDGIGVVLVVGLFSAAEFTVTSDTSRQSVIITVKTTQSAAADNRGGNTATTDYKSELSCTLNEGMMSVHALKANMLKVFGEIAKASGLNVVVDDALAKRTVSMSLENRTPQEVLQYMTSAYGLAMALDGDVYMISEGVPTDLATYRLSGTQSFPMKYVRAQAASELLPTFLYSYLHVNPEQNSVVVSAPTQMLDKIGKDLAKVDIAPPQIMVEAMAVELSSADDLSVKLGLNGQNVKAGGGSLDTETGGLTYTTIGKLPNDFEASLKTLVAEHKARIFSNPRMAVINGQKADIFVGAQRFIRVEYLQAGNKSEKVQGVDVGTRIAVTPWTGGNGEITTTIVPEVSNIAELDQSTGLPTLSSRRANTVVRVKDGETIVIGGLTQRQDYYTQRKVPFLGDLPIIGPLFRSTHKSSVDTELLLLITPRILDDSGHLSDQQEENGIKDKMLSSELE